MGLIGKVLPGVLLVVAVTGILAWIFDAAPVLVAHALGGLVLLLGSMAHGLRGGKPKARRAGSIALLAVAAAFATGILGGVAAAILHSAVASVVAGVAVYVHITRRPAWREPANLGMAGLLCGLALFLPPPVAPEFVWPLLAATLPLAGWAWLRKR